MKQSILLSLYLSLICFSVNAQVKKAPEESPIVYFNGFQNSTDIDSSLYFARKLASDRRYVFLLQDLIHNSFAQEFIKATQTIDEPGNSEKLSMRLERSKLLLSKMAADSSKTLAQSVRPIYYWMKMQESEDDINTQRQLTNNFIEEELGQDDFYPNRTGRYALLIHQIISKKDELKDISKLLLDTSTNLLKANQVKTSIDSATRKVLDKRAWYRCLYAYANNLQAKFLVAQGKDKEAEKLYQTSFEFSPDLVDNNHQAAYFYDMIFLTGEEEIHFQEDYLAYLQKNAHDKTKTLSTLLDIALLNPKYKERLRAYYNTNFQQKEKFGSFWIKSINANLKNNYNFSLNQIDGSTFSTEANKGKWILIDFWGTWCAPCRKEHPELQKFYEDVAATKEQNITVITIACRDTQSQVASYMHNNKYTFPVAMADSKIEKNYNIQGYPSKILVTPQGKSILIPFGIDWVNFIKGYSTF